MGRRVIRNLKTSKANFLLRSKGIKVSSRVPERARSGLTPQRQFQARKSPNPNPITIASPPHPLSLLPLTLAGHFTPFRSGNGSFLNYRWWCSAWWGIVRANMGKQIMLRCFNLNFMDIPDIKNKYSTCQVSS